jgi:hypothetical protein
MRDKAMTKPAVTMDEKRTTSILWALTKKGILKRREAIKKGVRKCVCFHVEWRANVKSLTSGLWVRALCKSNATRCIPPIFSSGALEGGKECETNKMRTPKL